MNRRSFLRTVGGAAAFSALAPRGWAETLAPTDATLLDDLAKRSFTFFWEQSDPKTGIVRGRARTDGSEYPKERRDVGSIGATGFSVTAMCIGAERGWITRDQARERVRATMKSCALGPVANEHGWFYHWLNVKSGERTGAAFDSAEFGVRPGSKRALSEVSTSDSTWLAASALTARRYFREDEEIVRLATSIYERVDYQWMCDGKRTLSHGWTPEEGFIKNHYDKYCQLPCMYLLGIASPTHPLPADAWYAWERNPNSYAGLSYVGTSVLWTYQWPLAWFNLHGLREDRGSRVDYFENSSLATRAHKAFCLDLARKFPGCYSDDLWGITSSESAHGYKAWGGPPAHSDLDGTVVPCASIGSLMFTPELCLPVIRAMAGRYGDKILGRYGFADAFHPTNGWVCPDVLAIDVGITLLAIENFRTGDVWSWFMSNPEASRALDLAGLRPESANRGA